ncbi:hypothetical protein VmeM32_00234 [Vibrio phage vB_VmeM-32]|nr:hypothetical protein VmeM32_00234 [Vibrio phage vB_VmeM-32]
MNKQLQTIIYSTNTFNRVRYNAGETDISDIASIDVMKFILSEYADKKAKFKTHSAILFDIEMFESMNDVLKYAKPLDSSVAGYVRQLMHMATRK